MDQANTEPRQERRGGRRDVRKITDLRTHDEAYITAGQFAHYLGVSRRQVSKWIGAKTLQAYRFGGRWWRIRIQDAQEFVDRERESTPQ